MPPDCAGFVFVYKEHPPLHRRICAGGYSAADGRKDKQGGGIISCLCPKMFLLQYGKDLFIRRGRYRKILERSQLFYLFFRNVHHKVKYAIHQYNTLFLTIYFRVEFMSALGADPVGKIGFRVGGDILFYLFPSSLIITNAFA
jgi:hypothetical protein